MAEAKPATQSRLSPPLRFALRFAVFAAIGLTLYGFPYPHGGAVDRFFDAYLAGYAHLAGLLLGVAEPNISVSGSSIFGRVALVIVKNCDAMEIILLSGAAMLALDSPLRDRLLALAAGVCAIVLLNLLRICSLYFVQLKRPDVFDTVHLEIWPPLLVAFTTLQFYCFSRWLNQRGHRTTHAVT